MSVDRDQLGAGVVVAALLILLWVGVIAVIAWVVTLPTWVIAMVVFATFMAIGLAS